MSPYVANEPTWAPPSLAPTCTSGWASSAPTASGSEWPMSARMNHVPRSSSTARSISSSAGVVPRSAAMSPSVRPTRSRLRVEGDVAHDVVGRRPCRRRGSRRARRGRRRASARDRRVGERGQLRPPRSCSDSTFHQPGMARNMMLRWSSVQLMSIGRVCTCGHTRAPRGPRPLDGGHHLVGRRRRRRRCGTAATAWSGCRSAATARPSSSMRLTVSPAS